MTLEAISAYHDLLNDTQLAADSQGMLDDQLGRQGLVFGGRSLCTVLRPRLTNHQRHTWLQQRVPEPVHRTDKTLTGI